MPFALLALHETREPEDAPEIGPASETAEDIGGDRRSGGGLDNQTNLDDPERGLKTSPLYRPVFERAVASCSHGSVFQFGSAIFEWCFNEG